jgi:glycosyltransferase involved in cell wall biosynthesis
LFLFPSCIDSFGLVLLESMSIWVPVISYNIFWAKEIVKDWYNWYLVSSSEEFVDRSYDVLSNLELQKNLSINCFNISNTFNNHTFDEELSRIFKSLV